MYAPSDVQLDRIRNIRLDLVMSEVLPPIQTLKIVQSYLTGVGEHSLHLTPPVYLVNAMSGFYISGWISSRHHVSQYLSLADELVPAAKLGWQHPNVAALVKARTLMRSVLHQLCT